MLNHTDVSPPLGIPQARTSALPIVEQTTPSEHAGLPAPAFSPKRPPRVLLCGVFGPFGVDDDFGRRENVMELFHNQVTKAQGAASLRFQHRSFGLYFLAANINAPVTVLDFPSISDFQRELEQGYDVVGISFIAPNFVKAREMARLVRAKLPHAKIVLGGHGAAIEGVEQLIECDEVARGEGIRWLRAWLGEDVDRPITHPTLLSADDQAVYGIPMADPVGLLVTGVGCVNACRFCATSHNFGRKYLPFLETGRAIFETACRISDELGCTDFFVMDENFLKDKKRALELLDEMEKAQRFFQFAIFSSADSVTAFGVDELVRLGVYWLWMGVESKKEIYEKNRGIDVKLLVCQLKDRGIAVLTSGILFSEEHTPSTIDEDIDFLISLEPTFTQFMQLTPLPVTQLYEDYKKRGLIDFDLPFEEWHGQNKLNFHHPHFTREQAARKINEAFEREHDALGPSPVRLALTWVQGARYLDSLPPTPATIARRKRIETRLREVRLVVAAMLHHAPSKQAREMVLRLRRELDSMLPAWTLRERALSQAALAASVAYGWRLRLFGDRLQPRTRREVVRERSAVASVTLSLGQAASVTA